VGELTNHIEFAGINENLVVWLNEIQNYLGPAGLESKLVRRILADAQPVILIGTIWPDRYDALTEQPSGSVLTDLKRNDREILGILADRKDLSGDFTPNEYERARALAARDPRIDEVIQHKGNAQLTAMLAAAPDLIRRWVVATNPYGAAVLSAAVFARVCGHPALLPEAVLRPLAIRFLTGEQRARLSDEHWFADALTWSCQPVRGNVASLIPQSEEIGQIDGYLVSDVLLQHARDDVRITRQQASENAWLQLIENASPSACVLISLVAYLKPSSPKVYEEAFRKAAEAGDIPSMLNMVSYSNTEVIQLRRRYGTPGRRPPAIRPLSRT